FVPNKVYLRGILLHYFIQKKSAAEAHRILVQTYGDNALSDTTCRDWFRRFKNNDFQLEDKERSGAPKKCQDKELEQLLDEDLAPGSAAAETCDTGIQKLIPRLTKCLKLNGDEYVEK
ncbi:MOS1T transposase, partial [Pseudoatta argentina]